MLGNKNIADLLKGLQTNVDVNEEVEVLHGSGRLSKEDPHQLHLAVKAMVQADPSVLERDK